MSPSSPALRAVFTIMPPRKPLEWPQSKRTQAPLSGTLWAWGGVGGHLQAPDGVEAENQQLDGQ